MITVKGQPHYFAYLGFIGLCDLEWWCGGVKSSSVSLWCALCYQPYSQIIWITISEIWSSSFCGCCIYFKKTLSDITTREIVLELVNTRLCTVKCLVWKRKQNWHFNNGWQTAQNVQHKSIPNIQKTFCRCTCTDFLPLFGSLQQSVWLSYDFQCTPPPPPPT